MNDRHNAASLRAVWDTPHLIALTPRLDGVMNAGGTTSDSSVASSTFFVPVS